MINPGPRVVATSPFLLPPLVGFADSRSEDLTAMPLNIELGNPVRSRDTRIILYLIGFFLIIILPCATQPLWHEQTINLRKVDKWRAQVEQQAEEFSIREGGIDLKLHRRTNFNGMVIVQATVRSQEQAARVEAFVRSLNPPRPVDWVLDDPQGKPVLRKNDLVESPH